jgi:hypothetical protein
MKAHHRKHGHRKHHETGGVAEYKEDLAKNPEMRGKAPKIEHEAEERKHGGRTKRKHGGHTMHPKHHKKHVELHGSHAKHHAGRKPRKSGGRAGSNMNPLSSAHSGTPAKGRHAVDID